MLEKETIIEKPKDKIVLDIKKRGDKAKKMKYTQYMNAMRFNTDYDLYKMDSDYNRKCPSNDARQPYIVNKTQLESFDPKAITGYMKYRDNYYICPRIWDAYANKPIAAEDFIKSGNKSPWSNGRVVDKKHSIINQDYNVIIRKPTSETKKLWANAKVEEGWPTVLKNTGSDAFPGFTSGLVKDKPKLCRPCCFNNPPEDYDTTTDNGMQEIKLVHENKKCPVDSNRIDENEKEKVNVLSCKNENYIMNETNDVVNCRFGLLPKSLDLLLNNNQDIFLKNDGNTLDERTNCFLRRGVITSKENGNILYCLAAIKDIYNIRKFKEYIISSITPELFITLNGGDLVKIYSSNEILPNGYELQTNNFIQFIRNNPRIYALMNITTEDINNYYEITDITDKKTEKTTGNHIKRKKFILLYKLYSAYVNFRRNIMSENSPIDYRHLLDLISRKNNKIFPGGVNVIIFDKEANQMECNPYINLSLNFVILIKENDRNFTPVFQVILKKKGDTIKSFGIIKLNKSIDITDNEAIELSKKKHNIGKKNLIEYSKHRSKFIARIFNIHQTICKNKVSYISNTSDINITQKLNVIIKGYVIINSMKIQYLLLGTGHLLPVYPFSIEFNLPIYLLTEIINNMNDDKLIDLWLEYDIIGKQLGDNFSYKPSKILTNRGGLATGIKFENGLIVPISVQKIPNHEMLNSIPREQSMVYGIDFENIVLKEKIQVHQMLYADMVYQQFKYDFSGLINENSNYFKKLDFIKYKNENDIDVIGKITKLIVDVMKPHISNTFDTEMANIIPGITLGRCYRNAKKNCKKNPFCHSEKGRCHINMEHKQLEYYSYMIAQDIYNSDLEFDRILTGLYVPRLELGQRILSR